MTTGGLVGRPLRFCRHLRIFGLMFAAYAILTVVAIIWGTTFPLVQGALAYASPMVFLAARFALAAAVFAALVWPRAHRLDGMILWKGMGLGLLLWAGYTLQTIGLAHTTAARSGFLTGLFVPLTPVFAWLLFRQRIGLRLWLAVGLAFAGVYLMSRPEAGGLNFGDLLTIGCAVAFALHVVFVGRWAARENEIPLTWLQFVMVTLLAVILLRTETPRLEYAPVLIIALLVVSLLGSVFGVWAQMRFQPRISPAAAAVIYALEPVFAGVASWVLQGHTPPPSTLIGAGFILAGMLLTATTLTPRKPAPSMP